MCDGWMAASSNSFYLSEYIPVVNWKIEIKHMHIFLEFTVCIPI